MFTDGKVCDMAEVLELCSEEAQNLHVCIFKYSFFDLHKSASSLKSC